MAASDLDGAKQAFERSLAIRETPGWLSEDARFAEASSNEGFMFTTSN
jgi:hypothetical protein